MTTTTGSELGIEVYVPGPLRDYCGGVSTVHVTANTVREALRALERAYPAIYFGTTTGQLWIGREGREEWECLFDALPPIHNVKVTVA